jgi:hypothetical protein
VEAFAFVAAALGRAGETIEAFAFEMATRWSIESVAIEAATFWTAGETATFWSAPITSASVH